MKYSALQAYFAGQRSLRLALSFDEVATAARIALPPSAFKYEAWWANDTTSHVQAHAWLDSGYRMQAVDLEKRVVSFVRAGAGENHQLGFEHDTPARHPLLGAMRETFSIEPGYDLTAPALSAEELDGWGANLDRKTAQRGRKGKPA